MFKGYKKEELDIMRFQVNEVNFKVRCYKSQNPVECSQNDVISYFSDLHI